MKDRDCYHYWEIVGDLNDRENNERVVDLICTMCKNKNRVEYSIQEVRNAQ